tara:strand:- start:10484 stop:10627 length:144 start_codon:yes stop_codon:yes gene_type:complete
MIKIYRTVPYDIFGVKLYSVERFDGYIVAYCDHKVDAQNKVDELNNE